MNLAHLVTRQTQSTKLRDRARPRARRIDSMTTKRASRNAYHRAWRAAHPGAAAAASRKWWAAHPEARRAQERRRPSRAAYQRARYAARPDAAAYQRAWNAAHPGARAPWDHARRTRARVAAGSFTAAEWLDKLTLFANCCIYCGEKKKPTIDHKVPLARGGTNDISNLVPACGSCNSRKGTKTAKEFLDARAHLGRR